MEDWHFRWLVVGPPGLDTSFRDPSGNNIRLTQVLDFDPARGSR
jgi:hypothetical protein